MHPPAPMLAGMPNCVRRVGLAALLTWHVCATPCRAEDVLDVPAACGSQAELEQGVTELLGANAGARAARPPVAMRRDGDDYVLEVQLEEGRRSLRDRDCRALFRAAVLIAALGREALIGLEKQQEKEQNASAATGAAAGSIAGSVAALPGSTAPSVAAGEDARTAAKARGERGDAPAAARASPTRRPTRTRETRMGALASAALAYGVVPDLTLALGAGIYLERGWFGGRFVASYQLPQAHEEDDLGVRSDALGASLTLELLATHWLKAGLGADFFAMHGRGLGEVPAARSGWATLGTLHAALGAQVFARKRWAFEAQARGLFAPQPARFEIRGGEAVYTTSRFGFQLALAWSWRFL